MGVLLSDQERNFLEALKKGDLHDYSYEYARVLRKNILAKELQLAQDLLLINLARENLQNLPSVDAGTYKTYKGKKR
jgi:hypothetical protein